LIAKNNERNNRYTKRVNGEDKTYFDDEFDGANRAARRGAGLTNNPKQRMKTRERAKAQASNTPKEKRTRLQELLTHLKRAGK
jgi:hypothetical protein